MKLALLAFLIAIPVGHYAAGRWLHRFAYRVDIAWWMYLAVGTLSLLIAFMTISFQSIRAASANPVTYSYSFIARSSSTAIMFTSNGGSRDYYIDNLLVEDVSPEGTYAERLNGSANEKYGLARWLVVAPGDVVSAEVYAKYVDTTAVTPAPGFLALLGQIAAKAAGVVTEGGHYNTSTSSFPFAGLGITDESEESGPKAYLNWLIFDRYDTLIDAGYDRLSDVPKEHGQNVDHEKLQASFTITEPGYVYLYLSNEEPDGHPVEVYFDDFKITHVKGKILAGGDYYPFGLPIDTRQVDQEKYRWGYQGQYSEKDSLTNWNTFQVRMYDARFGRWISPDPYGQYSSPYVGMGNMPHSGTDPDGGLFGLGTPWSQITGAALGFGVGAGLAYATGHEKDWWKWGLGGAAVGFLAGELTAGNAVDHHGSSTAKSWSGGKLHTNERKTKWNRDRLRVSQKGGPTTKTIEPDTWREVGKRRDEFAKLVGKATLDKDFQWDMVVTRSSGTTRVSVDGKKSQSMDQPGGRVRLQKGSSQVDFDVDPDYSSSGYIDRSRRLGLETNGPTGYANVWFEGTGPTLKVTHYRSGLLGLRVHTRVTKIIN